MNVHLVPAWLMIESTFAGANIGPVTVAAGAVGLAALALMLVAIIRRPSWRLLWWILPLALVHLYLQVVAIWLIGDHHHLETLAIYAATLLGALVVATLVARTNILAAASAWAFFLAYAWLSIVATLFVFWDGLH